MTIADYAEVTGRCTKTIRRWIKSDLLPSRRVPLGPDFSAFRYDISQDNIPLAEDIHGRQMRKLSGLSPGLAQHLRRRLNNDRNAMRWDTDHDNIPHEGQRACPRCGFALGAAGRTMGSR
jgi:hypothetical protein